ncbi:uncharacterized protein [Cebidichthys violaceus]|uniref:uncharacterized protein n=1 Tax=Cebidichthys violaceus TaxID=271503 RepID=UPI0035CB1D58
MAEGEHFVEKHQVNLIKRVSNIAPILYELLHENIIQRDSYDEIQALPTSQEKMAALFSGPLDSSGDQGKAMFCRILNEHERYLIDELRRTEVPVETMTTAKELLLETLNDLSSKELKKFKWLLQFNFLLWGLPHNSWRKLDWADRTDHLVDVMVQIWNQQSVEVTKEVFMDMNRTDLVQRLSETSSEPKEKHTVDEHWPGLIQKVETMASVIELLLETLAGLSDKELEKFTDVLWSQTDFNRRSSDIKLMLLEVTDNQNMVFFMVLIYGQHSVNKTKEVLKEMNRTDLVQRLSHSSSGPKKKRFDEHRSALIQRVATKVAVKQMLLETLNDLDYSELKKFQEFLQLIVSQKNLPDISSMLIQTADSKETVDLMMQLYGHQSVDLTTEVVKKMNRTDLMWRWSESSSGLKGFIRQNHFKWLYPSKEHSVDEHQPSLSESDVTMTSVQEKLLETLEDLSYGELEQFKHVLQRTRMKKGLPRMSRQRMETADRHEIVELMMEIYKQQSVEVTSDVLMEMNRRDLVKRLSDFSSGSKGPSGSLELEGCGSIIKDSSDWTKLEPEVNSTGADEAPTYSLQSEAGHFECSVSGLRWICKGKVRFKYQFSSVEEHMERINSMQYMAAGPLMNITVLAGKLDEVHLPHWICIEDNPAILDRFAVLHIDDCGDHVEKVSEVTSSHVKLCEPVFSLKMVLVRYGFSFVVNCKVLIYKTNKAFLTLHVYVIPQDPGLQQELDKRNESYGYRVIPKSHPEKSLKMNNSFILTTDLDGTEIYPENLMLRYDSTDPNFFEVFIENPDTNFKLQLTKENERQPVWTCAVRKDDYQSTVHSQEMALKTAKRLIKDTLADLTEVNFEKFLDELLDREGEPRVKRNQVENKSFIVVADVLVSTFTELRAPAVVVELLRAIGCHKDATKLEKEIGGRSSYPGPSDTTSSSVAAADVNTMAEGEHFVEKHQVNLIKRVSNIAPILDELLHENIIQRDSYDEIQALPTSQEKMAALFSGPLESSGDQGKAMFCRILNKHERYLIDELRRTEVPVETMTTAKELLLETLNDLSSKELKKFKWLLQFNFFLWGLPYNSWRRLLMADRTDHLVDVMVQIWNQQSVEVTKEVFMDMNRTDLVQRLSETSSEPKEKHTVDEHWPGLIQKVETMASVIELLLETLAGLSDEELEKFKDVFWSQFDFSRRSSDIKLTLLEITDNQDMVFFMVLIYGQHSVNKTKEVLKEMNRTDLVQRLSHSSSGPKKKLSDEHRSALIQRVATKAAVKQMLLETLNDLDHSELKKFQEFLQLIISQNNLPDISSMLRQTADSKETVDLMVQLYGHQSVDLTREVVKKMNRTDLMWRWSESSSGLKEHSVDEHQPSLSESEATMPSVQEKLLETLQDLNYEDLEKFKHVLQYSKIKKGLPRIPRKRLKKADRVEMVKLSMETYGQQSVEVTEEVNRRDLVERLSETSLGLPEEHLSKPIKNDVTMTSVQEKLLETLEDLSYGELEQFKHILQRTRMKKGLPRMSRQRMETADRHEIVELMMEIYKQQSVEVTSDVLMEMNRRDLVKRLSDFSSGSKGPSGSLELEGCGSIIKDSSDWTKLEPEVNSTGADEAPTYSLQSEAGHFECSVSGLRWICKGKVRFKYQFSSVEEHMERINSMQYMAAGPLMNITVLAGKLDEVHLPHWICIEDNPAILDRFAVLHIDDCGDHVEKVSEVTLSHVKLCEPVFSLKMVILRLLGLSVEIYCNVLIYKTNKTFLTLDLYLIPQDPGLQQELDKRNDSYGYRVIRKPHPEKSLKMNDSFILTTDLDGAEIYPEKLMLRNENPNFFEVFIENPDKKFELQLTKENERQPVWTCAVRKDEYQSIVHSQGEHFVDQHRCDLIDRVSNINTILDNLLTEGVISQEDYDTMSAIPTTQEKMRKLYRGPLKAAGHDGKDVFYKILEDKESYLVADLKRKGS